MGIPADNLKGKTYGNITAIRQAEKPAGVKALGAWWLAHCAVCNKESVMSANSIKRYKNCGCVRRKNAKRMEENRAFLTEHYADNGAQWCAEKLKLPRQRVISIANEMGLSVSKDTLRRIRKENDKKATRTRRNPNSDEHQPLTGKPKGHNALKKAPKIKHWGALEKPLNHGTWIRI